MKVFRPKNNRVHIGRSCGDYPGMLIEWIDNFKKTAFDAVHKPGHIKCRNIGTPGSRNDDFGFKSSKSQVSGFGCQVSDFSNPLIEEL